MRGLVFVATAFALVLCAATMVQALAFYNWMEPLLEKVEERFPDASPAEKNRVMASWVLAGTALHLAIGAGLLWVTLWLFTNLGGGALRHLLPIYIALGALSCVWQAGGALVFRVWSAFISGAAKAALLGWGAWQAWWLV